MKPFSLLLLASAFLIISACSQAPAETRTSVLRVEGMTCEACVNAITSTLTKVPGVASTVVSLEEKTATIVYDSASVRPEQLAKLIVQLGYTVPTSEEDKPVPVPGS